MLTIKKMRSKIYRNSDFLRYLWLRHEWKVIRKNAERMNDREFAYISYKQRTGKELNLDDPRTFDEKLWYLKLYNRDPLLTICSDKYRVREYVERCGLGHILNKLYGVYDDARDIDFDSLPSPCFLKCNHTSGYNIIFDRTKPFNRCIFIRTFNFILKQNYYWCSREWNYKNIEPKIIAERLLCDKEGNLPLDYKFLCFSGEPKLMLFDVGVCTNEGFHANDCRRNVYDENMNLLDLSITRKRHNETLPLTRDQFEEMKKYAAILSKPFAHCRVDFYCINDKVYFGEITFYHMGGTNNIQPPEWEIRMGSWIDVTKIKIEN